MERIDGLVDHNAFDANRAELARLFKAQGKMRWADWSLRKPAGKFLDHCHLDEEGNAELARWIEKELDHDH
jgi:hypothetical protein